MPHNLRSNKTAALNIRRHLTPVDYIFPLAIYSFDFPQKLAGYLSSQKAKYSPRDPNPPASLILTLQRQACPISLGHLSQRDPPLSAAHRYSLTHSLVNLVVRARPMQITR